VTVEVVIKNSFQNNLASLQQIASVDFIRLSTFKMKIIFSQASLPRYGEHGYKVVAVFPLLVLIN